ncbi:RNA polymerase sigma factor SigJ [Sneathiella limimaris]|uniref:RNA polymerase sigma factor SigJ n=1 Tax=Sneathiella limimaris TaxID=1964213 RepID=UPI001469E520|nr:RNA polymerase sigma factor SigJ [Sneathiella limimaris]
MQAEEINKDQVFLDLQGKLHRLAYRMLGTVAEAEDAVQEAWIRWQAAGKPDLDYPMAYFSKIVTRICLDALKKVSRHRESYVGVWLPEPVVANWSLNEYSDAPDEQEDISYALMMVLERLTPLERAAYLLHDLFEVPFNEIAEIIERTPATCRKLATRAREHIQKEGVRYQPREADLENLLTVFKTARNTGNLEPLQNLLSETVIFYNDGGGKVPAAINPIYGQDRVLRFIMGLASKFKLFEASEIDITLSNGSPALKIIDEQGVLQIVSFDLEENGLITTFYGLRNPEKLTAFT